MWQFSLAQVVLDSNVGGDFVLACALGTSVGFLFSFSRHRSMMKSLAETLFSFGLGFYVGKEVNHLPGNLSPNCGAFLLSSMGFVIFPWVRKRLPGILDKKANAFDKDEDEKESE